MDQNEWGKMCFGCAEGKKIHLGFNLFFVRYFPQILSCFFPYIHYFLCPNLKINQNILIYMANGNQWKPKPQWNLHGQWKPKPKWNLHGQWKPKPQFIHKNQIILTIYQNPHAQWKPKTQLTHKKQINFTISICIFTSILVNPYQNSQICNCQVYCKFA